VDGPNLYAYVNNDPLNWTDPMGTTILPWGDDNGTDDDIYIDDPVGDIFGIPSGDPEMDDVVFDENDPMSSGQSAGDCPQNIVDSVTLSTELFVVLNPNEAEDRGRQIADEVRIKVQVMFAGEGLWHTRGDAWRHAEWSRRMTEDLGEGWAVIFGYEHEIEGVLGIDRKKRQMLDETLMDLHNNRVGRRAGRLGVPVDVEDLRWDLPTHHDGGGVY
jgi:hypothetical protein